MAENVSKLKVGKDDLALIDKLLLAHELSAADSYRLSLEDIFTPLIAEYLVETNENKKAFVQHLNKEARKSVRRSVLFLSFLFDLTKDTKHFYQLVTIIGREKGMAANDQYNLLLHIIHLLMMNKSAFDCIAYARIRQKILKPMYKKIFVRMKRQLKVKMLSFKPNKKKILLITNMINNPRMTGPLWDTLEYANAIKQKFKLQPIVLNTNIWLQSMDYPIWPLRTYTTPWIEDIYSWPHRGEKLPLFRLREPKPTEAVLKWLVGVLIKEKPALAINIGDTNFYTDLIAEVIPSYTMHFTVDYPITINSRPTYHPAVSETSEAIKKALGIPKSDDLPLVPSYSLPGRLAKYSRQDFQVPANAFVYVVVGHRLDSEITNEFLDVLEKILQRVPQGYILFAGHFATHRTKTRYHDKLATRSAFIGNVADLSGFMEICDCYLNPDRTGGGSSSYYAMARAVPVLTLSRGDVAFAAGATSTCESYADLIIRAVDLAQNKSHLKTAKRLALGRAHTLSQRDVNLRLILDATKMSPAKRKRQTSNAARYEALQAAGFPIANVAGGTSE